MKSNHIYLPIIKVRQFKAFPAYIVSDLAFIYSGAGPVHACVPIHAHLKISPKQSQLHNKLPMYMINLIIIYVVVNSFSMKNNKSLRKLRVGVNRYMGVNWFTTTMETTTVKIRIFPFTDYCVPWQRLTLSECSFLDSDQC